MSNTICIEFISGENCYVGCPESESKVRKIWNQKKNRIDLSDLSEFLRVAARNGYNVMIQNTITPPTI